jgi:hypothetical protein
MRMTCGRPFCIEREIENAQAAPVRALLRAFPRRRGEGRPFVNLHRTAPDFRIGRREHRARDIADFNSLAVDLQFKVGLTHCLISITWLRS